MSKMINTLKDIAHDELKIETFEIRGRDSLDFHDLHVNSLYRALEQAYCMGVLQGITDAQNNMENAEAKDREIYNLKKYIEGQAKNSLKMLNLD